MPKVGRSWRTGILGRSVSGLAAALLAATLLASVAPAGSAEPTADLRAEIAALQADIADEERQLEALQTKLEARVERIEITEHRRERIITRLSERVGQAYRYGMTGGSTAMLFLGHRNPMERLDGLAKLDVMNDDAVVSGQDAERLATRLKAERRDLAKARDQQDDVLAELLEKKSELTSRLRVLEASTYSGASRLAPGPGVLGDFQAPAVTGNMACPVSSPYSFTDTWGAPRSGGRWHKGVDIFSPHGSLLYAVESGVVERSRTNSLGGIYLWLVGDSGNEYYYAHNLVNFVSAGERVTVGQPVGRMGNTGNARGFTSHLHWEVHPGGGDAVNPTSLARRLCP